MKKSLIRITAAALLLALLLALAACSVPDGGDGSTTPPPVDVPGDFALENIPEFSGNPYVTVNGNKPYFEDSEITAVSFERYSALDALGRCGPATASVGRDLMPTDPREGSLSSVTPSGWINKTYDIVDGGYLYNRAHLIGWQLTAETTNKENLITGTRYMNVTGMLPFENMVADYVKETGNHVMYRVSPIFEGQNLVCSGVLIEAYSVEDSGDGVEFCVYVYNNQPGIRIDYRTGESKLDDGVPFPEPTEPLPDGDGEYAYVLNTSTKKIHIPTCHHASSISETKKELSNKTIDELLGEGYTPCGTCDPQ